MEALLELFNINADQFLIIAIFLLVALSVFIVAVVIAYKKPTDKYKNIINPNYESRQNVAGPTSEKGEIVRKEINRSERKAAFAKKIELWYVRAGKPGKGIDYFTSQNLKFVVIGILGGVVIFVFFKNIGISLLVAAALSCLHLIDIAADVSERKKEFLNEFPFFLKTLSFVLDNGSNMATAFKEVTDKTRNGVLKEVMVDVMEAEKVNGGDFVAAFHVIPEKINCDDTKDFVEIVQNNYDKGVPIAQTFSSQSDDMDRFLQSKKNKKVKNLDNKMMLPLIFIFAAVALLIWSGIGNGGFSSF
jgi:Flp pilus assembly protein TadB